MRKRINIVCHAFPAWRSDYIKSTVELMKELAVKHNVLYVDYAYSFKDVFLSRQNRKHMSIKRILGLDDAIEKFQLENGTSIHVLSLPPVIPFNWINNLKFFKAIQFLNQKMINSRIKKSLRSLKMDESIIVNAFNPFFCNYPKDFGHKALLYYCYDNISASAWAGKHGDRLEKKIMLKADAIVFTSKALQMEKNAMGKSTHVVNNGVDLKVFDEVNRQLNVPQNPDEINIGYIGSIDNRLDYPLLERLISTNGEWNFHFIGRINSTEHDCLLKYKNVKFYGSVDVKSLPVLMNNFNAGIIPFIKNEFTKNIYPMKANEYLAMGLPVVMTDFTQPDDLSEFVTIAKPDSFVLSLRNEIKNDSPEKKIKRKEKAFSNSWKNRSIEFENILFQYA